MQIKKLKKYTQKKVLTLNNYKWFKQIMKKISEVKPCQQRVTGGQCNNSRNAVVIKGVNSEIHLLSFVRILANVNHEKPQHSSEKQTER